MIRFKDWLEAKKLEQSGEVIKERNTSKPKIGKIDEQLKEMVWQVFRKSLKSQEKTD